MKRILLDESLPRQLSPVLDGLDVVTVVDAGWAGKANGELLALAQREFDVLLRTPRSHRRGRVRGASGGGTRVDQTTGRSADLRRQMHENTAADLAYQIEPRGLTTFDVDAAGQVTSQQRFGGCGIVN